MTKHPARESFGRGRFHETSHLERGVAVLHEDEAAAAGIAAGIAALRLRDGRHGDEQGAAHEQGEYDLQFPLDVTHGRFLWLPMLCCIGFRLMPGPGAEVAPASYPP